MSYETLKTVFLIGITTTPIIVALLIVASYTRLNQIITHVINNTTKTKPTKIIQIHKNKPIELKEATPFEQIKTPIWTEEYNIKKNNV